ncbi:hypothetical protein AURDEDRAFT_159278 [Auricularia subglabra TFB-10046 SS5]|nr:hypothetical protein AURDEDRAFT_159278 [Auricularia subglabra TFB-10046 SS5]
MVMLLSPTRDTFAIAGHATLYVYDGIDGWDLCIAGLYVHLCHHRSRLGDDQKLDVIRLLLKEISILTAVCPAEKGRLWYWPRKSLPFFLCSVAILITVTRRIGLLLADAETFDDGEVLFGQLAHIQTKRSDGEVVTWELKQFLTNERSLLELFPEAEVPTRRLHKVLNMIRPLCAKHTGLRAHWDRIGVPPDDNASFFDSEINLLAFLENAERPDDCCADPAVAQVQSA